MAITYGFYNSVNKDRRYNAMQMGSIFDGIINDGVFMSVGTALMVTPGTGLNVVVGKGRAWFNHTWTLNDSVLTLAIAAPDLVYDRIDTVILEVDARDAVRTNTIKVLSGTPSATPVAPVLTNSGWVHQYPLAHVSVPLGVTQINAGHLTNKVGTSDCPFVTGPLTVVNIDTIVAQWEYQWNLWTAEQEDEFLDWFNLIKDQLSEDQAGHLQEQILALEDVLVNGWFENFSTWGYYSADGPTGVVYVGADMTEKVVKGTRIKYTQAQPLDAYWTFNVGATPDQGDFTMTPIGTPTYTPGKFGNALTLALLSSSGLSVEDDAVFHPQNSFTVGAWIKGSSLEAGDQVIFQSGKEDDPEIDPKIWGFRFQTNTLGKLQLYTYAESAASYINGSTVVIDNAWHYVVAVYKDNLVKLYVDGQYDGGGYATTPSYDSTNHVSIGYDDIWPGPSRFFIGQIDDLFFLGNYAIDPATILAQYEAGLPQGTSIVLTKYGIVTKVGAYNEVGTPGTTLITIYHGTDYALANSAITKPHYSSAKTPFGFDARPSKWTQVVEDYAARTLPDPTTDEWIGTDVVISLPIGYWYVNTAYLLGGTKSTLPLNFEVEASLGKSGIAQDADSQFTAVILHNHNTGASVAIFESVDKSGYIEANEKTEYEMKLKTTYADMDTIALETGYGPGKTKLSAVCAYL